MSAPAPGRFARFILDVQVECESVAVVVTARLGRLLRDFAAQVDEKPDSADEFSLTTPAGTVRATRVQEAPTEAGRSNPGTPSDPVLAVGPEERLSIDPQGPLGDPWAEPPWVGHPGVGDMECLDVRGALASPTGPGHGPDYVLVTRTAFHTMRDAVRLLDAHQKAQDARARMTAERDDQPWRWTERDSGLVVPPEAPSRDRGHFDRAEWRDPEADVDLGDFDMNDFERDAREAELRWTDPNEDADLPDSDGPPRPFERELVVEAGEPLAWGAPPRYPRPEEEPS